MLTQAGGEAPKTLGDVGSLEAASASGSGDSNPFFTSDAGTSSGEDSDVERVDLRKG